MGGQPAVELHELNRNFRWQDHSGPWRRLTPEQAERFDREGYFLLPGALAASVTDELTLELDQLDADYEARLSMQPPRSSGISRPGEITFNSRLVTKSPAARRLSQATNLVELAADLLGPDVRLYVDQSVYKKPQVTAPFPWHQDNGYRFSEPQVYLSMWIPLVPARIDNGCVWVWPGVHRRGTLRHWPSPIGYVCKWDNDGAVPVEADPGDVVVFSSVTPHCTGPNRSNSVRKAYLLQYGVEGMRDFKTGEAYRDPSCQYAVAKDGRPLPSGDMGGFETDSNAPGRT